MLENKKILIGITGGIAAYKILSLIRLLKKAGAQVKVIISENAEHFITKLSLATLSKNEVYKDFFDEKTGLWTNHIELGRWADLYLIAPATANTIAKMAYGIADNLLLTVYLSARCPVFFAPAMDVDMFNHPATQRAIRVLKKRGNFYIEPDEGELASGLVGKGRLKEPEDLFEIILQFFKQKQDFQNKKVLITAGPTQEPLDPVRFITNHSTGTMGYAIAEEFANRGAKVILVSGPVRIDVDNPNITVKRIQTAQQMNDEVLKHFPEVDIAVFAAAVADYTPLETSDKKIKKDDDTLILKLKKTPDIAFNVSKIKQNHQITVGFALETDQEFENAQKKLQKKKFDMIILNSLRDEGAGFGYSTNKITMIFPDGNKKQFPTKDKKEVAKDIVNEIKTLLKTK